MSDDLGRIARDILAKSSGQQPQSQQRPYKRDVKKSIEDLFLRTNLLMQQFQTLEHNFKNFIHELNVNVIPQLNDTTVLLGALTMLLEQKGVVKQGEVQDIIQAEAKARMAERQRKMAKGESDGEPEGSGGEGNDTGEGGGDDQSAPDAVADSSNGNNLDTDVAGKGGSGTDAGCADESAQESSEREGETGTDASP